MHSHYSSLRLTPSHSSPLLRTPLHSLHYPPSSPLLFTPPQSSSIPLTPLHLFSPFLSSSLLLPLSQSSSPLFTCSHSFSLIPTPPSHAYSPCSSPAAALVSWHATATCLSRACHMLITCLSRAYHVTSAGSIAQQMVWTKYEPTPGDVRAGEKAIDDLLSWSRIQKWDGMSAALLDGGHPDAKDHWSNKLACKDLGRRLHERIARDLHHFRGSIEVYEVWKGSLGWRDWIDRW